MSDMEIFVAVVESGSFTEAAQALDITPSAVSKLISRLELRLGVRLLTRTTRHLALTAEGELFLARARAILDDIRSLESDVGRRGASVRGIVRLSVGTAFARYRLVNLLPEFQQLYPDVTLDLRIEDQFVDVVGDHIDIALRIGNLNDSRLLSRRIAQTQRIICASPAYLARYGTPQHPDDLKAHRCLVLSKNAEMKRWPFRIGGKHCHRDVGGGALCNSGDMLHDLALQGLGVVRFADFVVGRSIAAGALVPLLQEFHDSTLTPISLVLPMGKNRPHRVDVLADFLSEKFKGSVWN